VLYPGNCYLLALSVRPAGKDPLRQATLVSIA